MTTSVDNIEVYYDEDLGDIAGGTLLLSEVVAYGKKDFQTSSSPVYVPILSEFKANNGIGLLDWNPYRNGNIAERSKYLDNAIENSVSLNNFGDYHGLLEGLGYVPLVGEPLDVANGAIYYWEGDYVNGSLSMGSAIPLAGYFFNGAKWVKRGADAVEDGNAAYRSFTKSNYRYNLEVLTKDRGIGMDAHHIYPQAKRFKQHWNKAEINIHDPNNMKWWEKRPHRQNAKAYNKHWDVFFRENKNATPEEIQNFGNALMKLYGL